MVLTVENDGEGRSRDGACSFSACASAAASTRLWEKNRSAKSAWTIAASAAMALAKAFGSGSSVVSAERPHA